MAAPVGVKGLNIPASVIRREFSIFTLFFSTIRCIYILLQYIYMCSCWQRFTILFIIHFFKTKSYRCYSFVFYFVVSCRS